MSLRLTLIYSRGGSRISGNSSMTSLPTRKKNGVVSSTFGNVSRSLSRQDRNFNIPRSNKSLVDENDDPLRIIIARDNCTGIRENNHQGWFCDPVVHRVENRRVYSAYGIVSTTQQTRETFPIYTSTFV